LTKKNKTLLLSEGGGELLEREVGFHTSSMNGFKNWMNFGDCINNSTHHIDVEEIGFRVGG